jgi:hypothetical protein
MMDRYWVIRTPMGDYWLRIVRGRAPLHNPDNRQIWFFADCDIEQFCPEAVEGALALYEKLTGYRIILTGTPRDELALSQVRHSLECALESNQLVFERILPVRTRPQVHLTPSVEPPPVEPLEELEDDLRLSARASHEEWPELTLEDEVEEWPELSLEVEIQAEPTG